MKEFVSHIDYLIQKHDCVIIPGFGGFIVNHEGSSIATDGSILPPKVSVGFNPDLKSNDGLLAESYMTMYSIPYDEACRKIEEAVKRLRTVLGMKHPVQIGRLGKLSLENNQLIFMPNANLSIFHPDTFGLSTVNLKRLSDIEKERTTAKRKSLLKRVLVGTSAVAAAVLVFFLASTPVSENENAQKSSFLSDWISSLSTLPRAESKMLNVDEATVSPEIDVEENIQDNAVTQPDVLISETVSGVEPDVQEPIITEPAKDVYYIIIAGAAGQSEADRLIKNFESQGLDNLGSLPSSGKRVRIYAASFGSRQDAEQYLIKFKSDNPKFRDAWVHHQK